MLVAVRLRPGDDLRAALEAAVAANGCEAAFVLSGTGNLATAHVRFAGAHDITVLGCDTEMLTLAGSIARNGSHLHVTLYDSHGAVIGGRVASGCTVRTPAEILVALLPAWSFQREDDAATGYKELVARHKA